MPQFFGCDAHKRYSVFVAMDETGKSTKPVRVEHQLQAYRDFLATLPEGSEIALESTGHWYWLVDTMEEAGHHPHLADTIEAKKRMGKTHKTDAIDARGLALLLRNGTLPEVWIPPREIRDRRELLRTRMALRNLRTFLKHRIHAAIDRYGLHTDQVSDLFGLKGREHLEQCRQRLPPETSRMIQTQLEALDQLDERIAGIEKRIREQIAVSPEVKRLMTLPGVGPTLGPVIAFEIGDIARFPHAERLASYAGLVPRVISSGGHTRHGRIAKNVNLYLKWAFVEAAVCAVKLKGWRYAHVRCLFARLQPTKGYGRAIVAVARHLAEAAFWVLTKDQDYRPPQPPPSLKTAAQAASSTNG